MARRKLRKHDDDTEVGEVGEIEEILSDAYRRIFDVVVRIPRGKVMTYGQVAEAARMRGAARIVGYAMRALDGRVPWQRVLGLRRKGIAHVTIKDPLLGAEQRRLLEAEGVGFSVAGTVELARYGHRPRGAARK
jgi:methylated-DNA-protein-cysteine methyltransferase-like protein